MSDTSPCSYRLDRLRPHDIELVDLVEFLHDDVLPRLETEPQRDALAVHATCSIRKMGLGPRNSRIPYRSIAYFLDEACPRS